MHINHFSGRGGAEQGLPEGDGGSDNLHQVLKAADFVVLCTPLTEETRGMIGKAELTMIKSTAFLINVGRGLLIDYPALLWALEKKVIAGVGLDVFWREPPDPADPIFRYKSPRQFMM